MRKALTSSLDSHRAARLLLVQLAFCFAAAFAADWAGMLDGLETRSYDWRAAQWHRVRQTAPPLRLIAADIDEKAEALTRPYPLWGPNDYMDALKALQNAGCAGGLSRRRYAPEHAWRVPLVNAAHADLSRAARHNVERRPDRPLPSASDLQHVPRYIQAAVDTTASFSGAEPGRTRRRLPRGDGSTPKRGRRWTPILHLRRFLPPPRWTPIRAS